MSISGYLYLRFEPLAVDQQLSALTQVLHGVDYDFPEPSYFGPGGTSSERHITVSGCQVAYWRSPLVDEAFLIRTLEEIGLRGFGWLLVGYFPLDRDPRPADHFAFGGHPYALVIDTDIRRRDREVKVFKAKEAVIIAAAEPDDAALIEAAKVYRHVKAAISDS